MSAPAAIHRVGRVRSGRLRRIVAGVLLTADLVLLALFVAGYLAWYVPPRHVWWLQLPASGLTILGLLVSGVGLGLLATRRHRRLILVHLLAGLLLAVRLLMLHRGGPVPDTEGPILSVVSYNAKAKYETPDLRAHYDRLFDEMQPQVVALQEATVGHHATQIVASSSPLVTYLVADRQYRFRLAASPAAWRVDSPVLSRLPIVDVSQRPLSDYPALDHYANMSRTVLLWQGQRIVVYNVHLRSFTGRKGIAGEEGKWRPSRWLRLLDSLRVDYTTRAEEAALLARLVAAERFPVILCGDFNATPHNWEYRRLARGMADAFGVAGHGWGGTFHSRLPLLRIDHLLVSRHWQVVSSRTGAAGASDHRPLLVRLVLKPETGR